MNPLVRKALSLLIIVVPPLVAYTGCKSLGHAAEVVDSVNDPADDAMMKKCRNEARTARDAGASKEDAYKAYFDCTEEGGLR